MLSSTPRFSVVMSAYNAGPYLVPAIEAIRTQTVADWEMIVVDDGSTDGTRDVLEAWQRREPRLRVLLNDGNRGVASSLNRAAREARGTWLARMDADDLCRPNRLAAQLRAAQESRGAAAVTCLVDVADARGNVRAGARGVAFDFDLLPWFSLFYNRIGGGGQLFCARDLFHELGGFDEQIGYGEDRELWLRLLAKGPIALVRQPLYVWRSTADSFTKRTVRRFRYAEGSLQPGMRAIRESCGVEVSRDEAVALRDFWLRFDDGTQRWPEVQRRLLQLAAAFRWPGLSLNAAARLRGAIAEGWMSHAARALLRRDRRSVVAHLNRARQAAGSWFPWTAARWLDRLAHVGGRADRLL